MTQCRIKPRTDYRKKIPTVDYVSKATLHTTFDANRSTGEGRLGKFIPSKVLYKCSDLPFTFNLSSAYYINGITDFNLCFIVSIIICTILLSVTFVKCLKKNMMTMLMITMIRSMLSGDSDLHHLTFVCSPSCTTQDHQRIL